MIFTSISDKNLEYFGEDILEYWKSAKANRTFFGLVDDDDNAIGVAVVDLFLDNADIIYFGIADEARGKGYGRYFMDCLYDNLNKYFVSGLTFAMYVEDDESPEVFDFLEHCGFTIKKGTTRRSIYDMEQVLAAAPFSKNGLPEGAKLIRGAMADDDIQAKVIKIAYEVNENGSYLNEDMILSEDNRYGGIMLRAGEVSCMLSMLSFDEGVRLEGMYAGGKALNELMYLFDYGVEAITVEQPSPKLLYVDTAEGNLQKFEDTLMKKKNISPTGRLVSMVATRRIEDE